MIRFLNPEIASTKYGHEAAISILTVLEREAGAFFVSVGGVFSFWVPAEEVTPL